MADNRPEKLRRLNNFRRHIPHASASALSAMLEEVRATGLPDLMNRNHMREARDLETHLQTPYGTIHQHVRLPGVAPRSSVYLEVQRPFAMLYAAAIADGGFSRFLLSRLRKTPPTHVKPWRLILYSDGVTPGDGFKVHNMRKSEMVYYSFLELGACVLIVVYASGNLCLTHNYSVVI
jgi:hypothetical protein